MDKLGIILSTLPKEAHLELEAFIQRQRTKKGRKDLELLKLLAEAPDLDGADILERLYPESLNQQAYHALRKRLMRQLTDFITLRRMRTAPATQTGVMGLITLAQHLWDHQQETLSWDLLRKAERQASKHDHHDLLNTIYNLQIDQAQAESADSLEVIMEKYEQNKVLAEEEERIRIAYAMISNQLAAVRSKGKDLLFAETIQGILERYQLTETVSSKPSMLYKLIFITRSAVVVNKDYYNFEPYLIAMYKQLNAMVKKSDRHREQHVKLLFMVAHVLYRNKKFAAALPYLTEIDDWLDQTEKGRWRRLQARQVLLKSMCLGYLGETYTATHLLEELLEQQESRLATRDRINARINLCFFRYQVGDLSGALRSMMEVTHSDKWLEKKMGKEWVVRKCLSEVLLQYDLGNMDIAQNKIRALERNHKGLLQQDTYERVRGYLQVLRTLINPPNGMFQHTIYEEARSRFAFLPMEQEDLQEVNYYAWLKATLLKLPYRDVLLKLVNRRDEPSVSIDFLG